MYKDERWRHRQTLYVAKARRNFAFPLGGSTRLFQRNEVVIYVPSYRTGFSKLLQTFTDKGITASDLCDAYLWNCIELQSAFRVMLLSCGEDRIETIILANPTLLNKHLFKILEW